MENFGIFDIIGPIMVGPSSSHTAGAVKIGNMALHIFGRDVVRVMFNLHGSFSKTYKGHGTDKALLSGVMGFKADDIRIKDAFDIADSKNLLYDFGEKDLGDVHPNTVEILLFDEEGICQSIIGSSVGGSKIQIISIDDTEVELDGQYNTLITKHNDKPGVIAKTTKCLSDFDINIAFMKVFRPGRGELATLIVQVDEDIPDHLVSIIENFEEVSDCKFIHSLDGQVGL